MDISIWAADKQVSYIESLGYFDLMGFLRKEWLHPGRVHSTRLLLDSCSLTSASWVLEVGCGTGASTIFAASTYRCRAVGVDRNLAMIDKAARRAAWSSREASSACGLSLHAPPRCAAAG
jgi:cyclopropane fatty-acyl-phospholipid synthase-like methyltransferase